MSEDPSKKTTHLADTRQQRFQINLNHLISNLQPACQVQRLSQTLDVGYNSLVATRVVDDNTEIQYFVLSDILDAIKFTLSNHSAYDLYPYCIGLSAVVHVLLAAAG